MSGSSFPAPGGCSEAGAPRACRTLPAAPALFHHGNRNRYFEILSGTGQTAFSTRHYLFPAMPRMPKPDPELLPIHRPRCPDCQMRMITADLSSGPEGFEHRTFECSRCGHTETRVVASDPLQTDAIGWTSGSSRRPPEQRHVFDTAQRADIHQQRK